MKITVAQNAGFCFGVQRALDIITKLKASEIFTVGPLIHNPLVVRDLERRGVRSVASVEEVPPNATVVIRSHGMSPRALDRLRERGANIIDATCPLVKRAQERAAELSNRNYTVVIIGEKSHPEVVALTGCAPGAVVVELPDDVPVNFPGLRVGVVVQTTQTAENFAAVIGRIARIGSPRIKEIRVFNTICSATAERQSEVRRLAESVDVVFVLGGRNSANTTRLTEIACEVGDRAYHLENPAELKPEMLAGAESVGVTAGASTPRWIIKSFVKALERLGGPSNSGEIRGETGD